MGMSRASVRSNGDVRGVKIDTNTSDVAAWDDTGSTDEGGTDVGDDSTVQVGHDHDVELARAGDQLHGAAYFGWGLVIRHAREQATYVLSTIMSLNSMPEDLYSSATRRKVLRKSPSPSFMMFALWTHVTFLRLFFKAKSKAKREIRSALALVETFKLSTTPG